jgi:hypothetical protein
MSGKVKEIEVWVRANQQEIFNQNMDSGFKVYPRNPHIGEHTFKAVLIVSLPERKVEITESMLDNALKEYESQGSCAFFKNILKQKLFGEKRDG